MKSRLILHAFAVAVMLGAAATARADDLPAETVQAAHAAGVDPIQLLGAVNSTGLGSWEYLYAVGDLALPVPRGSLPPYGLSPYLARVASCESGGFRPDVIYGPTRGRAGEIGLIQLHPRGLLPLFYRVGFTDPWNPNQAARFLEWAFANGLGRHWSCA